MFGGGRQAADEVIRNRVGSHPDLANITSSAQGSFAESGPRAGVAVLGERLLVEVPAGDRPLVDDGSAVAARGGRVRLQLIGVASIDFAAAAIGTVVAYRVRFGLAPSAVLTQHATALALPVAWLVLVALHRGFDQRGIGTGREEFARILRTFLHVTVLIAVTSYATHADLARGFLLIALPLTLALNLGGRFAARTWLRRHAPPARRLRAVLAVGGASAVRSFTEAVKHDRSAGIVVRGACLIDGDAGDVEALDALGVPRVGGIESVVESARAIGAATIAVVSSSQLGSDRLRMIAWQLEGTGMDLLVSPGLVEVARRRLRVRSVGWMPLLCLEQPEFRGPRRMVKEVMDRALALLAAIVFLPLFVAIFVAVRLSSPGPAIFRQTRVGRDGRTFQVLKFRSMFVDAESRLAELKTENLYPAGPLFKLHDDPRVTRLGRVLRRYSLDELPQLINVLAGHMSLVGPRPPIPSEVLEYQTDVRRRLLVKPGITGLWQVSGRSDLSWGESVRLDLRYVENWSPALDLMILWKTASAVVRGSGAY